MNRIPHFDGEGKIKPRTWLYKLQIFFTLNHLYEGDSLQMAILHLYGMAQAWWYHREETRDPSFISKLDESGQCILDHFDFKDDKEYLLYLVSLMQFRYLDSYVIEF